MHQEASRLDTRREVTLPDLRAPYFAHMRIRSAGRVRDVLMGARAYVDTARGVTIVDFRRAPIAEVFFTCDPGDEYEIEIDRRTVEGVLETRHLVTFERGEPSAITVPGGALRRVDGAWRFEAGTLAPSFSRAVGSPLAAEVDGENRERSLASRLDETQMALLERDPSETLLILGAAGSGKTTVAMHRIAAIARSEFDPAEVLVLVPEPGLRRLAGRMLADLGLDRVAVRTFDDWIRGEAHRVFPWLPKRESPDAPPLVRVIKRHPALFAAIDALVDDLANSVAARVDRLHAGRGAFQELIERQHGAVLAERLRRAEKEVVGAAPPAKRSLLKEAFREERRRLERIRDDFQRLVGDRGLLACAQGAAPGPFSQSAIEQVTEHTRRQLDAPSAERYAHVNPDRLETLDGRPLDEDTPDAVAGTVDLEDYAILFELLWRKTGRSRTRAGELRRYRHIVIDEAQGLAPIEVRVLGRALAEGGSATVAGDAAQRIGKGSHFESWDSVLSELGVRTTPAHLETSYRCPRPILDLAYAILGDEAEDPIPIAAHDGPPVLRTALPGDGHAAVVISEALRDLLRREASRGGCDHRVRCQIRASRLRNRLPFFVGAPGSRWGLRIRGRSRGDRGRAGQGTRVRLRHRARRRRAQLPGHRGTPAHASRGIDARRPPSVDRFPRRRVSAFAERERAGYKMRYGAPLRGARRTVIILLRTCPVDGRRSVPALLQSAPPRIGVEVAGRVQIDPRDPSPVPVVVAQRVVPGRVATGVALARPPAIEPARRGA